MRTAIWATAVGVVCMLIGVAGAQLQHRPDVLAVCFDASIPTDSPFVSSVIVTSPVEMNGAVTCPVGTLVDVRPQKQ